MQNIKLKGLRNTRDLGGLQSPQGVVRSKLLLRGGHLHDVGPREAEALQAQFDLRYIIDLRTDMERDEKPDAKIPGAEYRHMPILDEATVGITHEQRTDDHASLLSRLPDIRELYAGMVSGVQAQRLAAVVHLAMDAASRGQAVLYHCTEGKDRTGVVSLVLLWMLDVPMEAIMQDYLFTNGYAQARARKYYWLVRVMKRDKAAASKVRGLFLADKGYLGAAIEAVEQSYGSMRAFVTDGLGVDEAEREAFKHAMLC